MKSFRFSIFPSMLKIQKKQTTSSKAFTTIVLYFINYRKSKMISSRLLIPIYLLFYLMQFQVQNVRNVCYCIEMLLIGPWCWILAGECHLFFQELNLRKLLFIRSDKKNIYILILNGPTCHFYCEASCKDINATDSV